MLDIWLDIFCCLQNAQGSRGWDPMGGGPWEGYYGRRPIGEILWEESRGRDPLGGGPWVGSYGLGVMYGRYPGLEEFRGTEHMGGVPWERSYEISPMGGILWEESSGRDLMGGVQRGHPMGGVLYGSYNNNGTSSVLDI